MNHRRVYTRSGVFAWSGSGVGKGSGLVVAEAAQQIDLFRDSVSSFLDFLSVDDIVKTEVVTPLRPTRSIAADFKFNDLAWSPFKTEQHPAGLIVGGGESGLTAVFDAAALQGGRLECIGVRTHHQGHVLSVDVNSINPRWVCSGGAMGSVLLWDMNNPLNAMTPGKPNFEHQIKCVSWNRCSEHLLGSLSNDRCSIWDIRAPGAPALDVGDCGGGVEWNTMKWSPVNGTQLCMASQNDVAPIVTKWDLRFASSATGGYQLHSRGIYAMDWCPKDQDILVTVGKDELIIFQNPNTGKTIGQIRTNGWARKLSWCNTNPNLFAVSYFDQPVTVYSVSPFGPSETRSEMMEGAKFELSVIPAWLKPGPCGAGFSVGNKFCYFSKEFNPCSEAEQSVVSCGQVNGDAKLHEWVTSLLSTLDSNQLAEYSVNKASSAAADSQSELELMWTFISTHSLNQSRSAYISKIESHFPTGDGSSNEAVSEVMAQMEAFSIDATKDADTSEENGALTNDVEKSEAHQDRPFLQPPISLSNALQDNVELLRLVCGGSYRKGVAKALMEKNYLFALLMAQAADDINAVGYVAQHIALDESVDVNTRVAALMAVGMWDELIASWDISDWKSLFRLILSQAPCERKMSLCRKLAAHMDSKGEGLWAALPAVAGSDVEGLLRATESLPLQERISLSNILRQSIGGGSSRICKTGPLYVSALEECVRELVKEGFNQEAWKLLESVDAEHCRNGIRELKFVLYEALGRPHQQNPPEDPYAQVRYEHSQMGCLPVARTSTYYRPVPQSGYRSVDEMSPTRVAAPYKQFSPLTTTPPSMPQGFNQFPITTHSLYSAPPAAFAPRQQEVVMQNAYPPVSSYVQPPITGYSLGGFPAPAMPVTSGYLQSTFSQKSQTPPPLPPQNLYSSMTTVPPPPLITGSGEIYSSYPGRTRTVSSSSYTYPQYAHDTSPALATEIIMQQQQLQQQQSVSPRRGSMSTGWNDPPPLTTKKSSAPATVADIKWTPAAADDKALLLPQKKTPSPPPEQLYSLSESDQYLINVFKTVTANLRQADKSQMVAHKTADIEQKIAKELAPRLATSSFTPETLSLLHELARCICSYDFHSCQIVSSQLVGGSDFVELSPVMPSLRSLVGLAQRTFARR